MSPMMTHYKEIKKQYEDCILFYRLGDFYEMFFDDAIKASKLLDLTLTGRDCGEENRAPMCGIPYHASETYIQKLVSLGEKVAICEQVSDPKDSKGKDIVKREVVKIITAGTITESNMLDERTSNYIAVISEVNGDCAVSWSDITTGEFYVKKFLNSYGGQDVIDFLLNLSPSEILCCLSIYSNLNSNKAVKNRILPKISVYKEWAFNYVHAEKALKAHFKVHNLGCFELENERAMISSCGALIEYLNETQKLSMTNINKIEIEQDGRYMVIDSVASRNLELTRTIRDNKRYGSLLWLLDNTQTAMGARNLSFYLTHPLQNPSEINYRLEGVNELFTNPLMRNAITETLGNIKDVERLCSKIANGSITPKDCLGLATSLGALPNLKLSIAGVKSKILSDIQANISNFNDLTSLLNHAISEKATASLKDGEIIKEGFDKEVDRLRALNTNAKDIISQIELNEREKTGIKTLKVGYNKVFGYYIEVSNSFKDKVPYNYVRKQTLVNGERFITEELKQTEEQILNSKESLIALENEIYQKIKNVLLENLKDIQRSSRAIAVLDVLNSFAILSKKNNYCKPEILSSESDLELVAGRHPVVESVSYESFIANNCYMNTKTDNMLIITGPNMAGKSTYMRQVAIIVILAHIGCFVPCKSAKIPIIDRIFTRIGASDSLISDQSTFMVEMNEVSVILNKATNRSLVILDEVGRGTSTYDGLSIAWAVIEYITSNIKAKTLFATHYHELSELEGKIDGVKNYKVAVKEANGTIIFLRQILKGSTNKSFGIEVASLAGVPSKVTDKAKKILKQLQINNNVCVQEVEEENQNNVNENQETINMLKEVNIDNLTPRQALDFLYELKSTLKE